MSTPTARRGRHFQCEDGARANPGDLGPPENPILLQRALQVATETGMTLEALIQRAGLPEDDIRTILGHIHDSRPACRTLTADPNRRISVNSLRQNDPEWRPRQP